MELDLGENEFVVKNQKSVSSVNRIDDSEVYVW